MILTVQLQCCLSTILLIHLHLTFGTGDKSDPCTSYTNIPDLPRRKVTNIMKHYSDMLCDRYIEDGWYKAEGSNMATWPPLISSCGTFRPVWLADSFPPNDGLEYNRTACITSFLGRCSTALTIKMKNCGSFYVYYLVSTRACPSAYCFVPDKVETDVQTDPCINHAVLPFLQQRQYSYKRKPAVSPVCDNFLTEDWYKAEGSLIATASPGYNRCGTVNPIWLTDPLPPKDGREHTLRTCMSGYFGSCSMMSNIKIKHCGQFYVYYLSKTKLCPSAYCFDSLKVKKRINVSVSKDEPCTSYAVITHSYKRLVTRTRHEFHSDMLCDGSLTEGWYRNLHGDMVTRPPALYMCGTINPIWLAAQLPPNDGKEHALRACRKSYYGPCTADMMIKVKNCGQFNVYYLVRTTMCPSAYCFERKLKMKGIGAYKEDKVDHCAEYLPLPNIGKRQVFNDITFGFSTVCDRYLEERWYKVEGSVIVTKPPPIGKCGTVMPVWLADPLPASDGAEHTLKVCLNSYLGNCSWSSNIKMKNCQEYYVYYLVSTPSCPSAYCFSSVIEH